VHAHRDHLSQYLVRIERCLPVNRPFNCGGVVKVLRDAIAGVMVLSEVAKRLMMMSGSDASNCGSECGRAAASRLSEVVTTPSQRDIAGPANQARNFQVRDQVGFAWPHSKEVPSTQMQWRMTAIFRAMATFAFFIPIRLASFIPQALREDHFFVR